MENYPYASSHPDSGDSSPRSREIECEAAAAAAWDDAPPAAAASRVKLMCSFGGRIQPRSHDNQLSYVGGDTKILAVDRSIRYSFIVAKLSALTGSKDVILKYQLPGEDLDALISVTNDEDVEHMMIEYDRLHRSGSKPAPKLRLFLFAAIGKKSQDPASFAVPPLSAAAVSPKDGPDYLFGLEAASFVPSEPEMKEPAAEKLGIEVPPAMAMEEAEAEAGRSPTEIQVQVQELLMPQIDEKQQQQQVCSVQRSGCDETLTRAFPAAPAEYYAPPPVQEKAPPAPAPLPAAVPANAAAAYWPEHHRSMAPAARFTSFVGGDGNLYLIPANAGVFPAGAPQGQAYYTTVQRVVPAAAYDNPPPMYPPPSQQTKAPAPYDSGVRAQAQAVDGSTGFAAPPAGAYDNGAGYAAYDNISRPVYYPGAGATYQTVNNAAIAAESKALKPPQVS